MIAEAARTSLPLPSWLIWRMGAMPATPRAAWTMATEKAVRFEGDPARVPAAADRQQFGNDAVHAEAAADDLQQEQVVLGRDRPDAESPRSQVARGVDIGLCVKTSRSMRRKKWCGWQLLNTSPFSVS
jgi:hypothetical protein